MTKIALIWLVGVAVTLTAGRDDRMYQWESLNPWSIAVQCVGFVFLVVASLLSNRIIRIPYLSEPEPKSESASLLTTESFHS